MNEEKLKAALAFAKEHGLKSIEVDGIKMELGEPRPDPNAEIPDLKAEELVAALSPFDEMTDEEVLFWSTPHYDELQSAKALKAEHAKEVRNGQEG